jgi:hypothetical protein
MGLNREYFKQPKNLKCANKIAENFGGIIIYHNSLNKIWDDSEQSSNPNNQKMAKNVFIKSKHQ